MATVRRPGAAAWVVCTASWMALQALHIGPDPIRIVTSAGAFAVRALDDSGRRHPIATFDGRMWLVAAPRDLIGPPAPDVPAIVGLETSEGVPVMTVRVLAESGPHVAWARRAVEGEALGRLRLGDRRVTEVSTYVPAGPDGSAVYVDLTVRADEPEWRGAVVGAWVLPVIGAAPVVLGARRVAFRDYAEFLRIPRRHPLGIAVAGRGGEHTWIMYNRGPRGHQFELASVGRRGIREHPAIPRDGS